MLVEVAALADLKEGVATVVVAEGREIIVVPWREKVYALRNICPHQYAPFSYQNRATEMGASPVHTRIVAGATMGELERGEEEPLITCPWHAWSFKLADGRCTVDPALRVKSYKTVVEDGKVYLDMDNPTKSGKSTAAKPQAAGS
jgi:3-phenylpropionate/trans-cinnamate dioxygenase ferredoxin subunit